MSGSMMIWRKVIKRQWDPIPPGIRWCNFHMFVVIAPYRTYLLSVCAIYFLVYIYSNPSHKIINMSLVVNILQTAAVFSRNDSSDFFRKSQWGEPIGATVELLKICWWSWNTSVAPGVLRDFWRIECIIMQYAKIIVNEYTYIYSENHT